jgi:hypothetical protein
MEARDIVARVAVHRLSERRRRKCGEKFFFAHLKKLHSLPNFTFIFLIFQSLDDLARELLLD